MSLSLQSDPPAAARPKVLIVEDSPLVAMVLEEFIAELGWESVGPATRVAAACAMAREAEFDVALVDVNLDGEMSWPVGAALRERGAPFAFATGYDGASILPPEFRGTPVIAKPFALEEVKRRIEELLAARKPMSGSPAAEAPRGS
jgi:DNA-binding response OmpR family regulator